MPFHNLFPVQLLQNGFDLLTIRWEPLRQVSSLPLHHRHPFDRLIMAQTMTENLAIVSVDKAFDAYRVIRLW